MDGEDDLETTAADDIRAAMAEVGTGESTSEADTGTGTETELPAEDTGRSRDDRGRFAPKAGETTDAATEQAVEAPPAEAKTETVAEQPAAETVDPKTPPAPYVAPASMTAEEKAIFEKLAPEAKAFVVRREAERDKGVQEFVAKNQPALTYAKTMFDTIQPYMPLIRAEGSNAPAVVADLLNTAYILHTGSSDQKLGIVRKLIKDYGIDASTVAETQQDVYVDPTVANLTREVSELRASLTERDQAAHQSTQATIAQDLTAFETATDAAGQPRFPHYKTLEADPEGRMVALVQAKRAANPRASNREILEAAYTEAVWTNPVTRPLMLQAERETERKAEEQRRAEKSRAAARAGVSVTGAPGGATSVQAEPAESVADELKRQFAARRAG